MTALFSRSAEPVDPGLLSRALEVAGRLANDAAEVIAATAVGAGRVGTGRIDEHAEAHLYDWVTDTDRTLERHTRRVLVGEFPDVPVVGPEYGTEHVAGSEQTRYRWLVAPLDGVANYRAGLPWYGHALALVDASGPVVGVVSDPGRGEIYAAARGRGARVNGVPVRIPDGLAARRLPGAIPVCVEPPLGGWAARFLARAAEARFPVRVLGSVALAIAQVARSRGGGGAGGLPGVGGGGRLGAGPGGRRRRARPERPTRSDACWGTAGGCSVGRFGRPGPVAGRREPHHAEPG
jgi:myo-inositol-1(or 4)-monophosphatase